MAACGGVRRRPLPPEGREGANANVAPPPCAPSWEREDAGRRAAPDRAARQGRLGGRGSPSGPCRIKRNSSARCEAPPAWRGGRGSSPYATWLRSAAAAAVVPTSSLPPPAAATPGPAGAAVPDTMACRGPSSPGSIPGIAVREGRGKASPAGARAAGGARFFSASSLRGAWAGRGGPRIGTTSTAR